MAKVQGSGCRAEKRAIPQATPCMRKFFNAPAHQKRTWDSRPGRNRSACRCYVPVTRGKTVKSIYQYSESSRFWAHKDPGKTLFQLPWQRRNGRRVLYSVYVLFPSQAAVGGV